MFSKESKKTKYPTNWSSKTGVQNSTKTNVFTTSGLGNFFLVSSHKHNKKQVEMDHNFLQNFLLKTKTYLT